MCLPVYFLQPWTQEDVCQYVSAYVAERDDARLTKGSTQLQDDVTAFMDRLAAIATSARADDGGVGGAAVSSLQDCVTRIANIDIKRQQQSAAPLPPTCQCDRGRRAAITGHPLLVRRVTRDLCDWLWDSSPDAAGDDRQGRGGLGGGPIKPKHAPQIFPIAAEGSAGREATTSRRHLPMASMIMSRAFAIETLCKASFEHSFRSEIKRRCGWRSPSSVGPEEDIIKGSPSDPSANKDQQKMMEFVESCAISFVKQLAFDDTFGWDALLASRSEQDAPKRVSEECWLRPYVELLTPKPVASSGSTENDRGSVLSPVELAAVHAFKDAWLAIPVVQVKSTTSPVVVAATESMSGKGEPPENSPGGCVAVRKKISSGPSLTGISSPHSSPTSFRSGYSEGPPPDAVAAGQTHGAPPPPTPPFWRRDIVRRLLSVVDGCDADAAVPAGGLPLRYYSGCNRCSTPSGTSSRMPPALPTSSATTGDGGDVQPETTGAKCGGGNARTWEWTSDYYYVETWASYRRLRHRSAVAVPRRAANDGYDDDERTVSTSAFSWFGGGHSFSIVELYAEDVWVARMMHRHHHSQTGRVVLRPMAQHHVGGSSTFFCVDYRPSNLSLGSESGGFVELEGMAFREAAKQSLLLACRWLPPPIAAGYPSLVGGKTRDVSNRAQSKGATSSKNLSSSSPEAEAPTTASPRTAQDCAAFGANVTSMVVPPPSEAVSPLAAASNNSIHRSPEATRSAQTSTTGRQGNGSSVLPAPSSGSLASSSLVPSSDSALSPDLARGGSNAAIKSDREGQMALSPMTTAVESRRPSFADSDLHHRLCLSSVTAMHPPQAPPSPRQPTVPTSTARALSDGYRADDGHSTNRSSEEETASAMAEDVSAQPLRWAFVGTLRAASARDPISLGMLRFLIAIVSSFVPTTLASHETGTDVAKPVDPMSVMMNQGAIVVEEAYLSDVFHALPDNALKMRFLAVAATFSLLGVMSHWFHHHFWKAAAALLPAPVAVSSSSRSVPRHAGPPPLFSPVEILHNLEEQFARFLCIKLLPASTTGITSSSSSLWWPAAYVVSTWLSSSMQTFGIPHPLQAALAAHVVSVQNNFLWVAVQSSALLAWRGMVARPRSPPRNDEEKKGTMAASSAIPTGGLRPSRWYPPALPREVTEDIPRLFCAALLETNAFVTYTVAATLRSGTLFDVHTARSLSLCQRGSAGASLHLPRVSDAGDVAPHCLESDRPDLVLRAASMDLFLAAEVLLRYEVQQQQEGREATPPCVGKVDFAEENVAGSSGRSNTIQHSKITTAQRMLEDSLNAWCTSLTRWRERQQQQLLMSTVTGHGAPLLIADVVVPQGWMSNDCGGGDERSSGYVPAQSAAGVKPHAAQLQPVTLMVAMRLEFALAAVSKLGENVFRGNPEILELRCKDEKVDGRAPLESDPSSPLIAVVRESPFATLLSIADGKARGGGVVVEDRRGTALPFMLGCMGPLRSVDHCFAAQCPFLTSVDLRWGWQGVATIGNHFLAQCPSLLRVVFMSGAALAESDGGDRNPPRPGGGGAASCPTRGDPPRRVMPLREIGDAFLRGCGALTSVHLEGLGDCPQLERVGTSFLEDCTSVKEIYFPSASGFVVGGIGSTASMPISFKTMPSAFLRSCSSLTSVDLSGFNAMQFIQDHVMANCRSLTTLDVSNLKDVRTVGDGFLMNAASLRNIEFGDGWSRLMFIGDGFLSGAAQLVAIDFSGMSSLTRVGDYALSHCTAVKRVTLFKDVSADVHTSVQDEQPTGSSSCSDQHYGDHGATTSGGCVKLETVGAFFAFECPNLRTVDLSQLTRLMPRNFGPLQQSPPIYAHVMMMKMAERQQREPSPPPRVSVLCDSQEDPYTHSSRNQQAIVGIPLVGLTFIVPRTELWSQEIRTISTPPPTTATSVAVLPVDKSPSIMPGRSPALVPMATPPAMPVESQELTAVAAAVNQRKAGENHPGISMTDTSPPTATTPVRVPGPVDHTSSMSAQSRRQLAQAATPLAAEEQHHVGNLMRAEVSTHDASRATSSCHTPAFHDASFYILRATPTESFGLRRYERTWENVAEVGASKRRR